MDICFGSIGWVSLTVPAYDRTYSYWDTLDKGSVTAHCVDGFIVEPRGALLPFEASGKSGMGSIKNHKKSGFQKFKPSNKSRM